MTLPLLPNDSRQLGAYWLMGRLGAGGQGVVYEGYDEASTRVAVKVLHSDLVSDGRREMLRREFRTLRQVASFCTARVIDTELDGPIPFVVSEYVAGRTYRTPWTTPVRTHLTNCSGWPSASPLRCRPSTGRE